MILLFFFGCAISPWFFICIPVYVIGQNFLYILLRKRHGFGRKSAYEQFYINTMDLINEIGYISMCLKLKKVSFIFMQTFFFTNQLNYIMTNGNLILASHGLSLATLIIIISLGAGIW